MMNIRHAKSVLSCRAFNRQFAVSSAMLVIFTASAASGQSTDPPATRVEEDWILEIEQPDLEINSPQIATVQSPLGGIDGPHVVFEINHITLGDYAPGGMQLQNWQGKTNAGWKNHPEIKPLHVSNETVTFTSAMEVKDGKLKFEILKGQSESWGKFGGDGQLHFSGPTTLTQIDAYSPEVSVKYSKVGFGGNRVKKLSLKEVRYYSNGVLIRTDLKERIVHQTAVE